MLTIFVAMSAEEDEVLSELFKTRDPRIHFLPKVNYICCQVSLLLNSVFKTDQKHFALLKFKSGKFY